MALGSGTVTVLGTTLVAALAVGVAIGAHVLVGVTGASKIVAGASASPSPSASASGDFCALMNDLMALGIGGNPPFASLTSVLDTNESAALDAVHTEGQQWIDFATKVSAVEGKAAKIVADPDVAAAFGDSAKSFDFVGTVIGPKERDAVSVEAFFGEVMALALDPNAAKVNNAGEAANIVITDYVKTECGVDLGGNASSTSPTTEASTGATDGGGDATDPVAAAKTDATAVGHAVATAFEGLSAGAAAPTIDFRNGYYTVATSSTSAGKVSFDSNAFAAAGKGARIVDQFVTGANSWCVSVSYSATADDTYRYSAPGGLAAGTCAALSRS